MRRLMATLAFVAALAGPGVAHAAVPPPAEFGTDWDDPRTATPPVERPPTRSCTVPIVDHAFVNYDNYVSAYTPPVACPGPWAKVVLHLSGNVKGRQFDRLGWLTVGGVMVFKTSTPEPSAEGIAWSVDKDVSGYAPLLRSPRQVVMYLGNTVDDTYTGVLNIKVSLTFYATDRRHPAAPAADDVLPLADPRHDGADLAGTVTVPANTERLVADVYATGSGGGCEEFWYLTAPPATGYSCPADTGPYREVQVLLDGRVAGIAAPFPHVYTGGWSNPFLWYVLPAPRAFDIQPLRYDLSPYVGLLTDGKPHTVAVHVVGVPAGQSGWDTPIAFHGWRDRGSRQVTGGLVAHRLDPLTNNVTVDPERTVTTKAAHRLDAVGYVRTSHGLVTTVLDQRIGNDSTHTWGPGENPDNLRATWTDDSSSVVLGRAPWAGVSRAERRYAIDGGITVSPDNRLTTTITMTDAATIGARQYTDTYRGEASWTLNVPREQRHAVGTSSERYRLSGDTCYDRAIETRNGYVTAVTGGCSGR